MSSSRENFLIDSLKNVSLQRLRTLKMDLDRVARDSRIRNERDFWSLLEYHKIKFDERTKQDFYKRVADNRGVDIGVAIQQLKQAHRKTGRDSVEVLKKPELNEERIGTTPPATTTTTTSMQKTAPPKIPPSITPRNYKLDRFRESVRRIGRVQVAMKKKMAFMAATNEAESDDRNNSEENKLNPDGKQKNTKVQTIKSSEKDISSDESKENSSTSFLQLLLKDSENFENPVKHESHKKPKEAEKTNTKFEQTKTTENKLKQNKVPKSENTNIKEKEVIALELQEEKPVEESSNELNSKKGDKERLNSGNSSPTSEKVSSVEKSSENEVEPNTSNLSSNADITSNQKESDNDETIKDELGNKIKLSEFSNTEFFPNANEELGIDKNKVPSTPVDEQKLDLDNSSVSDEEKSENENVSINEKSDQSKILVADEIPPDDCKAAVEPNTDTSETPPISTSPRSEEINDTDKKTNDEIKLTSKQYDDQSNDVEDQDLLSTKTQEKLASENLHSITESVSGCYQHETKSAKKKIKKSLKKDIQEDKENEEKKTNKTTFDCNEDETKPDLKGRPEREKKTVPKNLADNDPEKNVNEAELNEITAKKLEESETSKETEKSNKNNPKDWDTWSASTVSSLDDNISSLNDILRAAHHSGACKTEKVSVGNYVVEMHVQPSMEQSNRVKEDDCEHEIEVDWVYGCNTRSNQCMSITNKGELVYFVGCIVILYNKERHSQRWYLEHDATITSVVSHPSENLVASAQCDSSTSAPSSCKLKEDSNPGHNHIRVWNHVGLETIHIIGTGVLRHPVFKMSFSNVQGFFISIEEDEAVTLTLWEGGCRVTSKTIVNQKVEDEMLKQPSRKFVSTRPRSTLNRSTSKSETLKEEKLCVTKAFPNELRCISGNLREELCFVTVGKHHVSFWSVEDNLGSENLQEGFQLSEPILGDFGKNFFKAEYITTCVSSDSFTEAGCILTGDSNGTLILWSEKSKYPVNGFPHAHQCAITSICLDTEGHIFTAGSKDRLVKAFNLTKSKIKTCGKIKIPEGLGSATRLECSRKILYVATEKNAVINIIVDPKLTSNHLTLSTPAKPNIPLHLSGKMSRFNRSFPDNLSLHQEEKDDPTQNGNLEKQGIFSHWDDHEIAKGFVKGIECVCAMNPLKPKFRHRKVENEKHRLLSLPSTQESILILRRQMAKSAQTRRRNFDKPEMTPANPVQAWKSPSTSERNSTRRPIISAASPRLRTKDRVKEREEAIEQSRLRFMPSFAINNYINSSAVFLHKEFPDSAQSGCFGAVSKDGFLHLYNPTNHWISGRCQLSLSGDVTSMDVCSRRHLVAIGTTAGHVTIVRINSNGFEILPAFKCRNSKGKYHSVNLLKFSPSGRKLAVSMGCEVIVCVVKRLKLVEFGRCINQSKGKICEISWTTKKYSATYLLRTCSLQPDPELKYWHVDSQMEVSNQELLQRVEWQQPGLLEYSCKGIWSKFLDPAEVSTSTVCHMKTRSQDIQLTDEENYSQSRLVVGDVHGGLHVQSFPSWQWDTKQPVCRVHSSRIQSVAVSFPNQSNFMSASEKDGNIVQWKLKRNIKG